MRRIKALIVSLAIGAGLVAIPVLATVFTISQGGTGITTPNTGWQAGSILIGNGSSAFATSTGLQYSTSLNRLTVTNASTTNLSVGLSGILKGNGVGSGVTAAINGTDFTLVSGQTCTNQVITALTASGGSTCSSVSNAMLANSTISGVSLGSNLNSLTHDSTLTGTSYNGSAAVSNWGIDLTHANTWTAQQVFNGGLTVTNSTTTNATTTVQYISSTLSVGSTTPTKTLSIQAVAGVDPFGISSSTATTGHLFTINAYGQPRLNASQPATSTSMTLDWNATPRQVEYQIGTSATTITLINATTTQNWGSTKIVWICNPNASAGALTWVGVEWIGTAPTQTTTANQCDVYSFDVTHATSTTAYKVAGSQGAGFQ